MEENLLSSLGVYKVGSIIDGTHSYVREMKYTLKVHNNNSHKKTTINFDSGIVFQKKFNWPLLHKPSCPTPPPLPTQHVVETKPIWKNLILVTGAADFISIYMSLTLKQCRDGVVGLENFNKYYIPKLKCKCQDLFRDEGQRTRV